MADVDSTTTPTTDAEGAAGTLLTDQPADAAKPDAEAGAGKEAADGRAADPTAAGAGNPAEPEAYKLTAPEGYPITAEALDGLNAVCKTAKLSKEQGEAVLKYMQGNYATATAAMQAQRQEMTAQWLADARADKEFGGDKFDANLADARKALTQFDTGGDIGKMLNETGYGNHPAVLRIFARVGKALGEDNLHGKGGGEAAEKPLAERFYPNM